MEPKNALKLGILGCGPRGAQHWVAAQRTGLFELTALADIDQAKLEKFATDHGAKTTYTDYRAMFAAKPTLDVLHICTQPNVLRLEAVRDAAKAGITAIVVEKPMALDYQEAAAMEKVCREAGALLVINHQKRGDPDWMALRQAVTSGSLGKITMVRANCYGNLIGQGTHLFDMAMHVMGDAKPLNVIAACDPTVGMAEFHPAPIQSVAEVEFDNGVRGTFSIGERSPQVPNESTVWFNFSMEVFGSDGSARVVLNQGFWRWDKAGNLADSFAQKWSGQGQGQEQLSRDIATALSDPSFKHPQRGETALLSFAMVEACCRSSVGGKVISFPLSADQNVLAQWSRRSQPQKAGAAHV
ncbi:MAG: Gfo/Idh/MocA family oxidoreductase [Chloroflexi bacterium]|nr:Gfo/Idh/MocA family oxidoreductase [Chloroflexota bacterium]